MVYRGQKARAVLTLVNHGSQAVAIERIETSCPCMTITPASILIEVGEKKLLTVEFDSSTELDFHGGLSIEVTGYASVGIAFHALANLEIRAESREEVRELAPSVNEERQP